MMSLHLQFVEEAEAWMKEQDGSGLGIKERVGGFAVSEPQSGTPAVLYHGRGAAASRLDMFLPDELFQTREDAERRMFELSPAQPGGCMGPTPPNRDEIAEATDAVLAALQGRSLLKDDEASLRRPMAESRRRAIWLLGKAVEEILVQDACETF